MSRAAAGSAHRTCQIALRTNPSRAIRERYPHSADSAASVLRAALAVAADSRRFSLASTGINTAAAIRIAIPRRVGLGSPYPSNVMTEVATTHAARRKSSTPAIRAACCSACSGAALARNRERTTTADASSMALSPPNATSAGLCARHAAKRDTAASALIHATVIDCTQRTRWKVFGAIACGTRSFYWCGDHDLARRAAHVTRHGPGRPALQTRHPSLFTHLPIGSAWPRCAGSLQLYDVQGEALGRAGDPPQQCGIGEPPLCYGACQPGGRSACFTGEVSAAVQVSNDLWIASHAVASGLTLITNNEGEFRRVRRLKMQNWAV